MRVFEQLANHGGGDLFMCADPKTGLRALISVHDTRLGPALGGSRFVPYESEAHALHDVLRLSEAMTKKAALAHVAHGGGKAVIMKPPGEFDRAALFERFGRFVDGLGGRYITTEDSGTTIDDMEHIRTQTRHVVGFSPRNGGSGDPSPFTALGVRRGIEACVAVALGRASLDGVHVAVQGVGHVGAALCRELHAQGARLTLADVRSDAVEALAAELGADVVDVGGIHRVDCDVFAPCALGGAIDDRTLPELRCRMVAGAANNQLAEARHGHGLVARGILYAPDYAINAGGLINVAEEVMGYDQERATTRTMAIYDTIRTITERALKERRPPHEVADAMVEERLRAAS